MKKFQIVMALATLLLFAVGIGCSGFFVDPVLTSIAIGPTATINQGFTVQESAVGTYNDGSSKAVTDVQWSTSDESIATVNTGGLVTGNSPGTATITGASGAVSGTSSITVNLGNVTALKITPASQTIKANGGIANFQAFATVQGQTSPIDVSATATWTISQPNDFDLTQGVTPETVTTTTATSGEQATVTATYQSTTQLTANATLTVQ